MKLMTALLFLLSSLSAFSLDNGKPAPDFKLQSAEGKEVSLASFKGKIVVLEWLNHGCPFVKKHYGSGNMQALQKKYTAKDVVWISIISSAPGKQGYVTSEEAKKEMGAHGSAASQVLLDPKGVVGKLYEAKTTPHMYVINKQGILSYQGAIDDIPDSEQDSVKKAKNYVSEAIDQLQANKPVKVSTTKAYGCSVKYL